MEETKKEQAIAVDKDLVATFLKMRPEERLRANDRAASAVAELRDAYRRKRGGGGKPHRAA